MTSATLNPEFRKQIVRFKELPVNHVCMYIEYMKKVIALNDEWSGGICLNMSIITECAESSIMSKVPMEKR